MTIDEYIRDKRQGFRGNKPAIDQRWKERMVANGWHNQGRNGAEAYLAKYGRSIRPPKLIAMAQKAESEMRPEVANRFWEEAYLLETGLSARVTMTGPTPSFAKWPEFPDALQPGKITFMQPSPAARKKQEYAADKQYWGIPVREGNRCLFFATPDRVAYQMHSGSTQQVLDPALDQALSLASTTIGSPYVLDVEELYQDASGLAHPSAKAAARANRKLKTKTEPVLFFSILRALFADGVSLVDESESVRVTAAANVVAYLEAALAEISEAGLVGVELVPISRTKAEKSKLCAAGSGEIWILRTCEYRGGMSGGESMVQTP